MAPARNCETGAAFSAAPVEYCLEAVCARIGCFDTEMSFDFNWFKTRFQFAAELDAGDAIGVAGSRGEFSFVRHRNATRTESRAFENPMKFYFCEDDPLRRSVDGPGARGECSFVRDEARAAECFEGADHDTATCVRDRPSVNLACRSRFQGYARAKRAFTPPLKDVAP
jgi:hypothetical protein